MKYLVVLIAIVGCGKSEKSEPAKTETKPAESKRADKSAVDKPSVDVKKERLCKRIDTDAVAKAIEVPGLSRTGNGMLIKGGSEPASLVCNYYEKGKLDGGASFGFTIKASTELEKRDALGRFQWEPFDGLGQDARIGRAKQGVHLQTVAKGVVLFVDVAQAGLEIPELEKRAVAATKAMIEQLPADVASELK